MALINSLFSTDVMEFQLEANLAEVLTACRLLRLYPSLRHLVSLQFFRVTTVLLRVVGTTVSTSTDWYLTHYSAVVVSVTDPSTSLLPGLTSSFRFLHFLKLTVQYVLYHRNTRSCQKH